MALCIGFCVCDSNQSCHLQQPNLHPSKTNVQPIFHSIIGMFYSPNKIPDSTQLTADNIHLANQFCFKIFTNFFTWHQSWPMNLFSINTPAKSPSFSTLQLLASNKSLSLGQHTFWPKNLWSICKRRLPVFSPWPSYFGLLSSASLSFHSNIPTFSIILLTPKHIK